MERIGKKSRRNLKSWIFYRLAHAKHFAKLKTLQRTAQNHYATLGLNRHCTIEQIRDAYRAFAKQHHPDLNHGRHESLARTQALNAAYEILSDPEKREIYDRELVAVEKVFRSKTSQPNRNITQEVHLRIEEFFRGTTREVRVNDPANSNGPELYDLIVPPQTAPGTRFRLVRESGGFVIIRARAFPHFQFKVRGADLRCDLKITSKLAAQGGEQMIKSALGSMLRVKIPARIARGEIVRIAGEGLPKSRGGRGDLLVRIVYRPEIRITRNVGK
jgi:curved DNA-binding protein CbpA